MAPTGEQESHGETGFGLVNLSLRIFSSTAIPARSLPWQSHPMGVTFCSLVAGFFTHFCSGCYLQRRKRKALWEPCHICSGSHMLRPRISSVAMDSIRQGALECARYLPPCKDTFATEDRAELFCRTQDRGLMPAMVSGFNCSHALPFNIDKRTRGGR
jgi:hypothetical protein